MLAVDSIRSRLSFVKHKTSGIYCVTPYFTLQAGKHDDRSHKHNGVTYLGLTVSKRIGNAVKRNRVKRRLRVACKQTLAQVGFCSTDYIFIAKPAILHISWPDLTSTVNKAVTKVNHIIQSSDILN